MSMNIHVLRESFQRLGPKADLLAQTFYDTLFARFPETIPLFAGVQFDEQRRKLVRALALIVRHVESPEFMRPYLQGLGALHVAYGVTAHHYPLVGECLLDALRQVAGDGWTEAEERAWRGAVGVISDAMLVGAARVA